MEYDAAERVLLGLDRSDGRPARASAAFLWAELGEPGSELPFVHVAGSNGKGSTAKLTESILREAGFSVGLFTSPHLERLTERIRVDGDPIAPDAVAAFVERIQPWLAERAAAGTEPAFFDAITAMGLWYFARKEIDVAVLEVGVGGAEDATGIVDPVASAVTSVSLDHTAVLGDTIADIAIAQAAVAPPGDRPLVTGATGAGREAIRTAAADIVTIGTPAADADTEDEQPDIIARYDGPTEAMDGLISVSIPEGVIEHAAFVDGMTFDSRLALLGAHQARNAAIATTLAGQVVATVTGSADADESERTATTRAIDFDADVIARGLRTARWPGRFETVDREPLTVLDGAHNRAAIDALTETLSAVPFDDLHLVFGAMDDKPHAAMIESAPATDSVVTCRPRLARAADPAMLARCCENSGIEQVTVGERVDDAFATACDRAGPTDCVLVTGSLFVVGEVRSLLNAQSVSTDGERHGRPDNKRPQPTSR